MESSLSWNNTFSPNTPAGATPGKSPYFTDLDHSLQQQQQQSHSQQQTPQQREISTPSGQQSTLLHNDTPSNFTDSDQMFLHHLEHNLYDEGNPANTHENRDHGAHTAPPSGPGSVAPSGDGSTPIDPSTYTHHHVHHHHHHHPQSNENTPNSHQSHETNVPSGTATPAGHTPATFGPSGSSAPPPPPSQFYEFGLENMNFIIPEDLDFDADPSQPQSAYPPSALPPAQTPSMLAANKKKVSQTDKRFDSPILPSQNERSYNNQHFYHKHSKSTEPSAYPPGTSASHISAAAAAAAASATSAPHQHVRPEAVFTPLVSPAVTPLDSQVNMNKPPFGQPPVQASFEPLTSPALNAQNSSADRRRTSSSAFVDDHHYQASGTAPAAPYHKRRTPLSTPVLQANNATTGSSTSTAANSRHSSSPSLKGVRNASGNFKSSPKTQFERLPESSMDSANTTPMLPPQGKKVGISSTGGNNGNAPLMGFTMGRLAEQSQTDDSEMDPDMEFDLDKPKRSGSQSGKLSRSSSFRGNNNTATKLTRSSSSSSTEASPKLRNQRGGSTSEDGGKRGEKPVTKKASHKLAEQGRRNRMNTAVQELGSLVPKTYHEEVTIPSKATTVELASNYIRDLLEEIERLKSKEIKKEE